MDLVSQDFPFQSIREKEFQKRIKGMANSCNLVSLVSDVSFCVTFASKVTKSYSADALDSLRRVAI